MWKGFNEEVKPRYVEHWKIRVTNESKNGNGFL